MIFQGASLEYINPKEKEQSLPDSKLDQDIPDDQENQGQQNISNGCLNSIKRNFMIFLFGKWVFNTDSVRVFKVYVSFGIHFL